jgi:hypothetical protein
MAALVQDPVNQLVALQTLQQPHQATSEALAAAALALQQQTQQHQQGNPLHRRVLRFVLGPLVRRGGSDAGDQPAHTVAQQKQQQPAAASSSLCGCSDDGTEAEASEDVLGMSPFASVADLQDYRLMLQQKRRERETRQPAATAAASADQQQHHYHQPGPLRRALQWLIHGLRSASRHVSPQGAGNNDSTLSERIFNVVTSVPFVLVGMHSLR